MPSAIEKDPVQPDTTLGPFSASGATETPWKMTVEALRRTQKFSLSTVRTDGRPHVTPLLAIWAYGAMWFATGAAEQKAKNLTANPNCILTTGTNTLTGMDYVIEGTAALVTDPDDRKAVAEAYEQAYGWHLTREDGTWFRMGDEIRSGGVQLYRVEPTLAFAFGNGTEFSQTRYSWPS
jgi:general stress protein 26